MKETDIIESRVSPIKMDRRMRVLVFSDDNTLGEFLVSKWREFSSVAIKNNSRFVAALSGGKTPKNYYSLIARQPDLPWDKTHLFVVDERYVPETDSDSNYAMIKEALLREAAVPAGNLHFVRTGGTDPALSAQEYEEEIKNFFGISGDRLPEFDLILLGIGKDGHTASLFPGSPLLSEMGRLAAAVYLKKGGHDRITLTLPVINNAREIVFLVTGGDKAEALRNAVRRKNDVMVPASLVNPERGNVVVLADAGAAMLLSGNEYEKV